MPLPSIRDVALAGLLPALLLAPVPVVAQPEKDAARVAAFLFAYDVPDETRSSFEEGYRRHLDWHRHAGDPVAWYGWTVLTGPHPGRFVDGCFGLTFADFDRRVDPAGDRADAAIHVAPFARPVSREVWRRRTDLAPAGPLERREQPRMLEVTRYLVRPGHEPAFEAAIGTGSARGDGAATWYELVSGGERPTYLAIVARGGFADYDAAPPAELDLAAVEVQVNTELWIYRSDLSYFPDVPVPAAR